jgi:hypothetical protein
MPDNLERLKAATLNGRSDGGPVPIAELARGLIALCREGNFLGAVERYYAVDVRSIEPSSTPHVPAELVGIEMVRAKNHWWIQGFEVHHYTVAGPFLGETQFAARFTYDVTCRATGRRSTMTEMALYTVEGDRIAQEEFFYRHEPGASF